MARPSPTPRRAFEMPAVKGAVRRLLVVFGDQLDLRAPVLKTLDRRRDAVLLMEVADEATHVPSHKQRTVLFLAAMRHYAAELAERGHRVRYITLDDPHNTQSFNSEFEWAVRALQPDRVVVAQPGEWRVQQIVARWQARSNVEIVPDAHFLCSIDEFAEWAAGRKELVLEHFYRMMRRKLGVLVDDAGHPEGGRWNYDADNRASFRAAPDGPNPYRARPDDVTCEVMNLVDERFADAPGTLDRFGWPVTRAEARRALRDFITQRLSSFGTYQDAMWCDAPFLYHSLLSPALNLKLLDPRECVAAAVEAYESGDAPLNAVEGFVRQIIGWREFIRGVYWTQGPEYAQRNELDQHGRLPDVYWGWADTDMPCLQQCLEQVFTHGYGHHIQRLMVTGNFALTAGVHPRAISDWYLAMYVDGVDWVTLPNTLGMVMHADGGVVGTKPYAASGQYIKRMSNYCNSCRYDPAKRIGPDACPLTTFYWDFLARNERRLRTNRRMQMTLRNLDRVAADERAAIGEHAATLRSELGVGDISGSG